MLQSFSNKIAGFPLPAMVMQRLGLQRLVRNLGSPFSSCGGGWQAGRWGYLGWKLDKWHKMDETWRGGVDEGEQGSARDGGVRGRVLTRKMSQEHVAH